MNKYVTVSRTYTEFCTGIQNKLNYLRSLDVKTLLLSAIYPSSRGDEGILNHTEIDPVYGTLDDFRALVRKMHKKGVLDKTIITLNLHCVLLLHCAIPSLNSRVEQ